MNFSTDSDFDPIPVAEQEAALIARFLADIPSPRGPSTRPTRYSLEWMIRWESNGQISPHIIA